MASEGEFQLRRLSRPCMLSVTNMTPERQAVWGGSGGKREPQRLWMPMAGVGQNVFSLLKLSRKKESKPSAKAPCLVFCITRGLNCTGIKKRVKVRTSDPELHYNVKSIQVPFSEVFLRWILSNFINYFYFTPSFLFVLRLSWINYSIKVFNYSYYPFSQSKRVLSHLFGKTDTYVSWC